MRLKLSSQNHSLQPFEADVPKFTLVTGLNGSGKSQLLAAIHDGQIECEFDRSNIRMFHPLGFAIDLGSAQHGNFDTIVNRAEFLDRTALLAAPLRTQWLAWGEENGIEEDELKELTAIAARKIGNQPDLEYELHARTNELYSLQKLLEGMQDVWRKVQQNYVGDADQQKTIQEVQTKWSIPYFLLNAKQLRESIISHHPLFEVSVGSIFTRYRDELLRNRLARLAFQDGDTTVTPLSVEEFFEEKGPPPWELINNLLADLNVDAKFEPPPSTGTQVYQPLMITSNGVQFHPNQLSTGEHVILALATIGYAASDRRNIWKAPSLVLLDEVDAPLHPAMAKTYLKVIKDVLIDQFGMHVIATTHSPSTVAQSDLDEIYVMQKGTPGLAKISRSQALLVLTEGVPTLSVSIQDRRQVFAESPVEAENLDRLYQILKPSLNSQLSLQFIATGSKQVNSSKSHVQRIVEALVRAGNTSVYGVIDWDTTSQPTERIKVIAGGRRYALENVILDPLVIAVYMYRKLNKDGLRFHGLDASVDPFSLKTLPQDKWQSLANAVSKRVLGSDPVKLTECHYHGGLSINIDQEYLRFNAHDLEDKIVVAFPVFEKIKLAGSGKLTAHLIEHVLMDFQELIPVEVSEVFHQLLALK